MNILILSENKDIFNPHSKAFLDIQRMNESTDAIHVIVCTSKKDPYTVTKISEKLFLYPTHSNSRLSTWKAIFNIVKSEIIWKSECIAHLIIAEDSLLLAHAAYKLSQKYKRNYMVTLYENTLLTYGAKNPFTRRFYTKMLDRIYAHASAIQVETQLQGEIISSRNHSLEKKIFILPFVNTITSAPQKVALEGHSVDLRKKFPQFNIIVLAYIPALGTQDLKRAKAIMVELHNRYPRMGLVIVSEKKNFSRFSLFAPSLPPHIVTVENATGAESYFESSTVFIDSENESHEVSALIRAIHAGCVPVVSPTKENLGIIRDGENGFIVDPKKPNLFARKIMEVLETPGLRMKMRMYRYDITDLYGNNPEDYYTRLFSIWSANRTPLSSMRAEPAPSVYPDLKPITPPAPVPIPPTAPSPISTTVPEPAPVIAVVAPEQKTEQKIEQQVVAPQEVQVPTFTPPAPTPSPAEYYPAFTLALVKKAFKRFEKSKRLNSPATPINAFENEIFDVDSVQIGIKQALKDIVANPELVEDEKDRSWGDDIEILR